MTDSNTVFNLELAKQLTGGNLETAEELFSILKETLPEHRDIISKAYASRDYTSLQNETHKLRGATSYTGTVQLNKISATLETALNNNDADSLDALCQNLLSAIDQVMNLDVSFTSDAL